MQRNFGQFLIGAFAQTNTYSFRQQLRYVSLGAPHISLDHRAHTTLVSGRAVQLMNKVQRALGISRTLHINPHKVGRGNGGRTLHESADQVTRQLFLNIQAHVSQLQADICVQPADSDLLQQLMVKSRAGAGFIRVGDVLAQVINRNRKPFLIQRGCDPESILHPGPGHKTCGNLLPDREIKRDLSTADPVIGRWQGGRRRTWRSDVLYHNRPAARITADQTSLRWVRGCRDWPAPIATS